MTRRKESATRFLRVQHLHRRLFSIPLEEASFSSRGFRGSDIRARKRLERIGVTFLLGYHAALDESNPLELIKRLNRVKPELRGFAFEGAAMGVALLDLLTPWNRGRWLSLMNETSGAHCYMMHVGVGWALARLGRWFKRHPSLSEPLLRWLAIDGYGFHEGYFHWRRFIDERALPERLFGYERRVFDQGLGRSIWFVEGADVEHIRMTIAAFPVLRQADLWSGVGLACAYAGGVNRDAVQRLPSASVPYASHLCQGVSFAAKTRQRAGNPAAHTEMACEVICGLSADEAAQITDTALENLPGDNRVPIYETWRQRIQAYFL